MNIEEDNRIRQIIPRWHPFDYAYYLGEIKSKAKPPVSIWTPESYKVKEHEWLLNKQLPYAIDFVGTALVSNDYSNSNAIEASEFILKNSKNVSNLVKQLAEKFLQLPDATPDFNLSNQKTFREKISSSKKYIHKYHQNAIVWADMAFYYTVLGQNEKANHCINIALNLAPENRFILRAAARFYSHIKNPEKALFFLRATELTKYDSWLLASEISIAKAFDLGTSNIKIAKNMLKSSNETPRDLAELFGTIGTVEAMNGKNKKAKKLFRSALIDPNENTFAQAEWISRSIGFDIDINRKIEAAFEAISRYFYKNKKYDKSLKAALNWLRYQPFSSYPIQHATYVAGVCLNDFQEVLNIVENEVSPSKLKKDFIIKNNYIFSLASLDKIKEAEEQLNSLNFGSLTEKDQATYYATKGLIEFRKGQVNEGRKLYEEAIERFGKLTNERSITIAKYYLAREEKRSGNEIKEISKQIIDSARKLGLEEILQSNILNEK